VPSNAFSLHLDQLLQDATEFDTIHTQLRTGLSSVYKRPLGMMEAGEVKQPTGEIRHTVYWHNGSNTMWYALVVFIPGKNMVVAVTANNGDIKAAESAAWKVVNASANQFHGEGDATRHKSERRLGYEDEMRKRLVDPA
jgi:hypothetical protein